MNEVVSPPRMPTGLEPLPPREGISKYCEMLEHAEDGAGLSDPSGVQGMYIWNDNTRAVKDLSNLELLQITAINLGGAVIIERNGNLSEEAQRYNKEARHRNAGKYSQREPYYYSVLIVGITTEELEDALEWFDPLDNEIQC